MQWAYWIVVADQGDAFQYEFHSSFDKKTVLNKDCIEMERDNLEIKWVWGDVVVVVLRNYPWKLESCNHYPFLILEDRTGRLTVETSPGYWSFLELHWSDFGTKPQETATGGYHLVVLNNGEYLLLIS